MEGEEQTFGEVIEVAFEEIVKMASNKIHPLWVTFLPKMLGIPLEEVPGDLLHRVARVCELVEKCGGESASRQALAVIVAQWERDKEISETLRVLGDNVTHLYRLRERT